jgi:hypothetical protein
MPDLPEPQRPRPVLHVTRSVILGSVGRIGSTIYGTVLVMAALTAAYAAERHDPQGLVELVVSAVVVFWIAYVYAHALSESIESGKRLNRSSVTRIASRELGIVLAAAAPVCALLLGVAGLIDESASVWLAIGVGLAILTVQGYRYARIEAFGPLGTTAILVVNLLLGICVVVMKVALVH